MAKIAAGEKLSLQTWVGKEGPEVRLTLTEHEADVRGRIGAFLKNYVNERLRDPETRALNSSPVFRNARAVIFNTTTSEALGRVAADLLRVNERRSEELRRRHAAPEQHPPPTVMPLNRWERTLLFNGRAPEHHTPEMRELRLNYGLTRKERSARVADLRDGNIEASIALSVMLAVLNERKTAKAIAHFQASLINEKMSNEGNVNLHLLSQRIPPHERSYLYELTEERKKALARSTPAERVEIIAARNAESNSSRAFGAIPRENQTLREYMASMGQIERQLLNEALIERGIGSGRDDSEQSGDRLTITKVRALLPEAQQREIRLRARNLAWQSLVPEEVFERNPLPEAVRISDTIACLQDYLQESASVAHTTWNDFVDERAHLHRMGTTGTDKGTASLPETPQWRKQFIRSGSDSLSPAESHRSAELERYAAQTREEVFRAFELLDVQRRELGLAREQVQCRALEAKDSPRTSQAPSEQLNKVRAEQLPTKPSDVLAPKVVMVFQQDEVHIKAFAQAASSTRVQSDQLWHFDSLREALKLEVSRMANELQGRVVEPSPQMNRDIAPDR